MDYVVDEGYSTDYYLTSELTSKKLKLLDKVLKSGTKTAKQFNRRIVETAEMRGRECVDITLRDEQVKPMLMSLITKRFFIGDEPGLGKTVMSASCYANYVYQCLKKDIKPTKVLVVTTASHVKSFANEWGTYGIKLLPLMDGSLKIERALRKADLEEYDGLAINWSGLKTNGFLDFFMRNYEDYQYAVLDETGVLKKDKSSLSKVVDNLLNKYKKGIERVIFLNGSSFESNVFDFYYQFKVLKPKLIPNKQFIEDNYVERGGPTYYAKTAGGRQGYFQQRHSGAIVDYKNQEELRDRLKYYFLARSKSDYASDLPEHNYKLHVIEMTARQKKLLKEDNSTTILNSPKTRNEELKLTVRNSPKLSELVEFAQKVDKDRPLIYVYNIESQKTIKEELEKLGYKVAVLNGNVTPEEKAILVEEFNNYEYDMLVFNVHRALSIPTSDRMLFYDIPTMPTDTTQLRGRIDRNNYDTPKFYDFFCYLNSPEMRNIIRLAYFREKHGNAFTGQESFVYEEIIKQLSTHYGRDVMQKVEEKVVEDEEFFDSDEWEELYEEII